MEDIDKDKRIKKEFGKLKKICRDLDENKQSLAYRLCERIAFMCVTLDELESTVKAEGAIICFTNGNGFETMSEHPAQKSYNTMIKNYNSSIKTLSEMVGGGKKSEDDPLLSFIRRDKK